MKNLSYILAATLLVLSTFSAVTYTSCNSDKCKDIFCRNGGSCADGNCTCPDGYSGKFCQTPPEFCDLNTCMNGGTCEMNRCQCPAAYEGTLCEKEARAKFMKSWLAHEHITGEVINISYGTIIEAGDNINEVKIINIYDQFNHPVIATINGNKINIALQGPDSPNKTIQGVGTYDVTTNSINWIYAITYPPNPGVTFEGVWQGN